MQLPVDLEFTDPTSNESETCIELCSGHDSCTDGQLCCSVGWYDYTNMYLLTFR